MLVITIQNNLKDTILNHIKQCSNLKTLESIYATMFKTNFNQDCFLMNQFITASSSFSSSNINFATSTFTQIIKPNTLCLQCTHQSLRSFSFIKPSITTLHSYAPKHITNTCGNTVLIHTCLFRPPGWILFKFRSFAWRERVVWWNVWEICLKEWGLSWMVSFQGAILNGCKVHRNLDIACVTVQNLMVLEPSNSGHYSHVNMLLINVTHTMVRFTCY